MTKQNTSTLYVQILTEARSYIAEALHAAKSGQETHAYVAAESALHRLRSITELWEMKNKEVRK
jgi:hypothetical protein